jgi:hypothetical protein
MRVRAVWVSSSSGGRVTVINSTISAGGVSFAGKIYGCLGSVPIWLLEGSSLSLVDSTLAFDNIDGECSGWFGIQGVGSLTLSGTVVEGSCDELLSITSNGHTTSTATALATSPTLPTSPTPMRCSGRCRTTVARRGRMPCWRAARPAIGFQRQSAPTTWISAASRARSGVSATSEPTRQSSVAASDSSSPCSFPPSSGYENEAGDGSHSDAVNVVVTSDAPVRHVPGCRAGRISARKNFARLFSAAAPREEAGHSSP